MELPMIVTTVTSHQFSRDVSGARKRRKKDLFLSASAAGRRMSC
jgi:hypothetical protein